MKNTVTFALLLGALCLPAVAGTAVAGETIGIILQDDSSLSIGIRGTRFAVKVEEPSTR